MIDEQALEAAAHEVGMSEVDARDLLEAYETARTPAALPVGEGLVESVGKAIYACNPAQDADHDVDMRQVGGPYEIRFDELEEWDDGLYRLVIEQSQAALAVAIPAVEAPLLAKLAEREGSESLA